MTDLSDALELVKFAAGRGGYRNYPGTGSIWIDSNDGMADANFVDWGLGRAAAVILNAVANGHLVSVTAKERSGS